MRRHYRPFAGLVALLMIGTLLAACGETAAPSAPTPAANIDSVEDLTIIWAQWSPSDYLQQLVKDYKDVAG
ncbi:MAG TPA: hypothetical protein VF909_06980, partial [Roseiflexaceae bacterium]